MSSVARKMQRATGKKGVRKTANPAEMVDAVLAPANDGSYVIVNANAKGRAALRRVFPGWQFPEWRAQAPESGLPADWQEFSLDVSAAATKANKLHPEIMERIGGQRGLTGCKPEALTYLLAISMRDRGCSTGMFEENNPGATLHIYPQHTDRAGDELEAFKTFVVAVAEENASRIDDPPQQVVAALQGDDGVILAVYPRSDDVGVEPCKGVAAVQEVLLTGEARSMKHTVIPRRDRAAALALSAAFADKGLSIH